MHWMYLLGSVGSNVRFARPSRNTGLLLKPRHWRRPRRGRPQSAAASRWAERACQYWWLQTSKGLFRNWGEAGARPDLGVSGPELIVCLFFSVVVPTLARKVGMVHLPTAGIEIENQCTGDLWHSLQKLCVHECWNGPPELEPAVWQGGLWPREMWKHVPGLHLQETM